LRCSGLSSLTGCFPSGCNWRSDLPSIDPNAALRKRQRDRSLITAALLFGFVALVFAISVAKIKLNW
jgi:hypothetical protein